MTEIKSMAKFERLISVDEFVKALRGFYQTEFVEIEIGQERTFVLENGEEQIKVNVRCSFSEGISDIVFEYNTFMKAGRCKTYITLPYSASNAETIKTIVGCFGGWFLERDDIIKYVPIEKNKEYKRIDIMTDIETLGKGNTPPVFQIGSAAFDIKTGEIIETFNEIADISELENIEGDTLIWWLNTNKELLAELLNKGKQSGISEEELISNFVRWINSLCAKYNVGPREIYLWGNGILFDNRIIKNKCMQYGEEYPIYYRSDRDMRTIVELAGIKTGLGGEIEFRNSVKLDGLVAHDAFDDVRQQIAIVSAAYNALIN